MQQAQLESMTVTIYMRLTGVNKLENFQPGDDWVITPTPNLCPQVHRFPLILNPLHSLNSTNLHPLSLLLIYH